MADAAEDHTTGTDVAPARAGLRTVDLAALALASVAIGIAVSAIMSDIGTSAPVVVAASALAYSGTGELAYASVIASGGGLLPATVAALLVSSRFGLLAMSMRNRWPAPWWERIGMAHMASEPAVAAAIEQGQHGERAARRAFWQLAIWMAVGWVGGTVLGLLLGNVVGDTRRIGLDAVFPASFVGVLITGLRRRDGAVAVLGGATAALALTPFLPAGLPILLGSAAAIVALLAPPVPTWGRAGSRRP